MNLLKVFTKLWQPTTQCYPFESWKAVQLNSLSKIQIGSAWNYMFYVQDKTSSANTIRSTSSTGAFLANPNRSRSSTEVQDNSNLPIHSVLSKNLLLWTRAPSSASSEGPAALLNILPIEIQLSKLVKTQNAGLPENDFANLTSNATFFLRDSLDHVMRTALNPPADHNNPVQQRSSNPEEFTRVSCFGSSYGPKNLPRNSPDKLSNERKCFSTAPSPRGPGDAERIKIPKLILIRNPLTWLSTKFDFRVLKTLWDPQFVEDEFKDGTVKAISTVTQVLSESKFEELVGLLTKPARACLLKEVGRSWPKRKLKLIALSPSDIQISVPRKVYFLRIADKRFCDVDMAFMALKWISPNKKDGMLFAEIFARFHREYTQHCIPEWTIAYFKVTRFEILKK